ncbi:MAG: peptidoglycan D,D-transpeptidase FtsI family protein [Solirubrobacterales bacterium]
MNKPIRRVFYVVVALFTLLAVYTARWTVIEAQSLNQNALNRLPAQKQQKQPRGAIYTANGGALARSRRTADGTYVRAYPLGSLFAHPVGYSYAVRGQNGLEKYYNDRLTGEVESFTSILDSLLGRGGEEQSMVTNLDRGAQSLATNLMAGRSGAVVVIEPSTGRVPVYVSVPGYDPAALRTDAGANELFNNRRSPLVDRVSDATYPPGSTFKVVTATAALDSGLLTPEGTVDGSSPQTFSGQPLANFGGTNYGQVTLSGALQNSVNTAFGNIGVDLGEDTMLDYMERYGFYKPPPVDLPAGGLLSSGLRDAEGDLLAADSGADLARLAIGQERLAVTPIQMATVAATVANDGIRMEPRLARLFRDRLGRVKKRIDPERAERVMTRKTASELNEMMRRVVEGGTGQAANVGNLRMAGKTGTAEVPGGNQAWFIGFAPYDDPQYAIAVTIEKTDGFGGTVAAPVARDVLQDLLGQ